MPRSGRRKPIEAKEAPPKTQTATTQMTLARRTLYEAPQKPLLPEAQSLKPKAMDNQANVQTMELPRSSNVKSFGILTVKQNTNKSASEGATDEGKANRKKKVELVTTSLLLGYNQIRGLAGLPKAIDQVMYDAFERLQWLDLQHNYLTTVSEEIAQFPNLKTLYLHANFIPSIKEFANIKGLTQLRNLTVHGNPLVRIPHFRLYFVALFPDLKKLDTVLISKKERDNARVMVQDFKVRSLPVYAEADLPVPPPQKETVQTTED